METEEYKPPKLELIVGAGDDEDDCCEDAVIDMRAMTLASGDGEMPPTIFLDDDVIERSSFAPMEALVAEPVAGSSTSDMDNFVRDFFASEESTRLFQPISSSHVRVHGSSNFQRRP
jgi:hypothetical protein